MTIWTLLEVIFDRSANQNPPRTKPLVSVPRSPKSSRAILYGSRKLAGVEELASVADSPPPMQLVVRNVVNVSSFDQSATVHAIATRAFQFAIRIDSNLFVL